MIETSSSSFRLDGLAKPKRIRCQAPRSAYSSVSLNALKYHPTDRVINLSLPKIRKEFHVRHGNKILEFSRLAYDPSNSGVFNKAALRAECSEYLANLAKPKTDYKGYKFADPVETRVSKSARTATASDRILNLSLPKIRKDNN